MIIKIPKFFTTANIQIHNFNATFMCKRSIAGVPFDSAERFQVNLLLCTIRMHSQRLGGVGGVAAYTQTNRKGWKKGKVDGPVTLS